MGKVATSTGRCYESHPALKIGEHLIYGGSCIHPIVTDADVYVGFDLGMPRTRKAYPWEPGESFLFTIKDQHAPDDIGQFTKLIDWLAVQLIAQAKVHVGCIGGHGRTGTVLAALVATMTGEKDAIAYVRQHYCQKAVESQAQVDFLVKHFGIVAAHVEPRYGSGSKQWESDWLPISTGTGSRGRSGNVLKYSRDTVPPTKSGGSVISALDRASAEPTVSPMSIWGANATFDK